MKKIFFLLLNILLYITVFSQTDSLVQVFYKTKSDTDKINILNRIVYAFEQINLDSSKVWAQKGFQISLRTSSNKGLGNYYNHKGRLNLYVQNYDSAIFYFNKSYKYYEKIKFAKGMISCNNNIGASYTEIGSLEKALNCHFKNVEIGLKVNDMESVANSYVNIANAYNQANNYYLSVQNILKAIPIYEKLKLEKSLGTCYYILAASNFYLKNYKKSKDQCEISNKYFRHSNTESQLVNNYSLLANIYHAENNFIEAIKQAKKGVVLANKNSNSYALFFLFDNIAMGYKELSILDSAGFYSEKAINIAMELNYETFKLKSYFLKGQVLYKQDNIKLAILYLDTALTIANKNKDLPMRSDCNYFLALCYKRLNDFNQAYSFLNQYSIQKDSIYANTNTKTIFELQALFETEKKELQIKNQSLEIGAQEKQNKQKSLIILFGALALVGSGFFGTMAFINFKKTKKANEIIENQKKEVELINREVTLQKDIVEEKQKEIIDSINYAKRIQQAVLTGAEVWNKIAKENFILFKPKDIVSGDFYWAYNTPNNRSIFALADCTGHGVPGGFMSMLGNSFLNEIIVENKIFKADEILNKLRSKVIKALEQKGGTQQKDGMDISLCVWNKLDNTLDFAGANNPLWLLRGKELLEYKADKMPIGLYLDTEVPFTSVTIQLQAGDIIFLSTDGYADQFGGPKGKKYKYKPLIESLIKNSQLDMASQKTQLEAAFNEWKGQLEQVDDVSIVGIKVV